MRRFVRFLAGTIFLSLFIVSLTFAGGYQLNEHGARATGLGGAFVAQASDPSAIYFNPAGLAFQKGINVMGGGTLIFPSTTFKPANIPGYEVEQESQLYYPPNLYGTYAINDQWVVGLGVFTPFGLGSEWDKDWIGKRLAVKSEIQTFYFNPSIAYKINDQLSIGVGVSMVYATVTMSKRVPAFSSDTARIISRQYHNPTTSSRDGSVELEATSTAFNYNFGILYKPIEELSIGFSFRAETKIDFTGTATFTDMQASTPYFPGGEGKATLPMPMNIQVGASYDILPTLTVEADFQFVKWSSYKELTITMPVGPTIALPPPPLSLGTVSLQAPSTKTKNWDDGYLGRFGIEYKYSRDLTLRGGVVYDITPQPASKMEPMLPDANRIDPSVGIGYKITDQLSVDFVYMVVLFSEGKSYYTEPGTTPGTTTSFGGTYNSTAHLFGFDVSYSF